MVGILQRWLGVAAVALLGLAAVIATAPGAAAAVGSVASVAHAYDTAAYSYDSPLRLSTHDVAAPSPWSSPATLPAVSREASVSLGRFGVAAKTADEFVDLARRFHRVAG